MSYPWLHPLIILTSVTQKNVPSAVVYYYYAWYVFLRDRRYYISVAQLVAIFIFFSAWDKRRVKWGNTEKEELSYNRARKFAQMDFKIWDTR